MNNTTTQPEAEPFTGQRPSKPDAKSSPPEGGIADYQHFGRSDEEFVRLLQDGSSSAFEKLERLYSRRLFKQIVAITKNHEDAEDALQDTFLKAFLSLRSFEGRSHIATWLMRIAINMALMKVRKRRSLDELSFEGPSQSEQDSLTYNLRSSALNPEELYEQQQRSSYLIDAIQLLKPTLRTTVNVWIAEDCSLKEVAKILNVSTVAIKTRVHRARRRFRDSHLRMNSRTVQVSSNGHINRGSTLEHLSIGHRVPDSR